MGYHSRCTVCYGSAWYTNIDGTPCRRCGGTGNIKPYRRALTLEEGAKLGWNEMDSSPRYCDDGCCAVCNTKLTGRKRTFCSKDCWRGYLWRVWKGAHWQKRAIAHRDGAACRGCGELHESPIRPGGKPYPHYSELQLDHIRPFHRGGDESPGNCQLLCEACHGNKTRSEAGFRSSKMTNANKTLTQAWKVLTGLATARKAAKTRELELCKTRKDLDNQLDALGAGNSPDHLRVSRDYVVAVRSIDYERDRMKTLADKMETTIDKAMENKFDFEEEFDERELVRRPTESELFVPPPPPPPKDATEKNQMALGDGEPTVGRSRKKQPEAPQPTGENQHLEASVQELDMRDDLKTALTKAGFETIAQIATVIDSKRGDEEAQVVAAVNCSPAFARAIIDGVARFRMKHRKAIIAKELGEENPPDNRAKVGGKGAKPPKGGL